MQNKCLLGRTGKWLPVNGYLRTDVTPWWLFWKCFGLQDRTVEWCLWWLLYPLLQVSPSPSWALLALLWQWCCLDFIISATRTSPRVLNFLLLARLLVCLIMWLSHKWISVVGQTKFQVHHNFFSRHSSGNQTPLQDLVSSCLDGNMWYLYEALSKGHIITWALGMLVAI